MFLSVKWIYALYTFLLVLKKAFLVILELI